MTSASSRIAAVLGVKARLPLTQALDDFSRLAADVFGARIWFAEILGLRWSYIAGVRPAAPAADVERIELGSDIGLLAGGWGDATPDERSEMVAFLRNLAGSAKGKPC